MGRPPAYIFVVRHGNRLDAADKQWHISSPTPYDPPLTYGGWLQSKILGARIASILREREVQGEADEEAEGPDKNATKPSKARRYRVIIHSSPFLRCHQTSVAISAGLASNPSLQSPSLASASQQFGRIVGHASSFSNVAPSQTRPAISIDVDSAQSWQQPLNLEKAILRLDPFLGEWLSPDYFEHITPPPRSSLMMVTAKAELLRKENYNAYPHFHTRPAPPAPSHLWNSPRLSSPLNKVESAEPVSPLESLPSLGEILRDGNGKTNGSPDWKRGHGASFSDPAVALGYTAPIPSYAISTTEPIPQGYVAHARDACVEVDYQWDSTREELAWGDGGSLPEEWAGMHQRFRKGLKRLVDWYATSDQPGEMVTTTPTSPHFSFRSHCKAESCAIEDDEDIETENVVILVSHGAGCNALVGGITNQPVLADVPMSSLTVARRRPEFDDAVDVVDNNTMSSLDDAFTRRNLLLSDLYELKLFANTDHLHPSAGTTPRISRSASISGVSGAHGRLTNSLASALREINLGPQYGQSSSINRSHSVNASLGSMRRSSHAPALSTRSPLATAKDKGGITVGGGVTSFAYGTRSHRAGSVGLWQPQLEPEDEKAEDELPTILNLSHEQEVKKAPQPTPVLVSEQQNNYPPVLSSDTKVKDSSAIPTWEHEEIHEEKNKFDESSRPAMRAGVGTSGLWGSPRPPGDAERLRDFTAQKRRWTVNER
ncbi:uncharacterized protein BCR38DRAFT_353354 [Pseudomassariella vexata]|uniref:Histidine phosphatase superfamily n=1 Tax=Pseudomassariella vexata TaxID=1141098 RepID=A0A1Y2DFZ6_9PEZI|nr:uncharacterized protein BCR38DRAFT_353354 [Pseudomassariella vexata]ORY58210.1 hypothetical protein BCR38DRAFT_353354 [Pseudomassariella vexata]